MKAPVGKGWSVPNHSENLIPQRVRWLTIKYTDNIKSNTTNSRPALANMVATSHMWQLDT